MVISLLAEAEIDVVVKKSLTSLRCSMDDRGEEMEKRIEISKYH
jgi:hypothetical protein